ncbi:MAG: extracellular solute-binding protein, partial [Treponema sp.]|nr:extracellular solute-binding protein [Treponema sp.]
MKKGLSVLLVLFLAGASVFAGGRQSQTTTSSGGLAPVTLSFIFYDSKKSATDEVWNAIAEEFKDQLNAKFDVSFIAGSDYIDKMLVKFSAGDVWDLNFDGDWLQYYRTVAMNGYMALDDLLPRYAPDLYQAYQSSGAIEAAKVNGKVVALPWTNIMTNRPFFQWRSDLINADPAQVKTVEDVERILYQLKQQYPDRYTIENANVEVFL